MKNEVFLDTAYAIALSQQRVVGSVVPEGF